MSITPEDLRQLRRCWACANYNYSMSKVARLSLQYRPDALFFCKVCKPAVARAIALNEVELAAELLKLEDGGKYYCPNCGRCLDEHGHLYCSDLCEHEDAS